MTYVYYTTAEPAGRAKWRYLDLMDRIFGLPKRASYAPSSLRLLGPQGLHSPSYLIDVQDLDRACTQALTTHTSVDLSKLNSSAIIEMVFGSEIWPLLQIFNAERDMSYWVRVSGSPVTHDTHPDLDLYKVHMRDSGDDDHWIVLEGHTGTVLLSEVPDRSGRQGLREIVRKLNDQGLQDHLKNLNSAVASGIQPPKLSPAHYEEYSRDGRYLVFESPKDLSTRYGTDTDTSTDTPA